MTKRLAVIVFTMFCLVPCSKAAFLNVKFCYEENEQAPYILGTDTVPHTEPGILVELVSEASKVAKIKPRFIRRPWLRCQKMVKLGQAQGLFAMIKTEPRLAHFKFPNLDHQYLLQGQYVIFYKRGPAARARMEQLAHQLLTRQPVTERLQHGLGAPLGYVFSGLLQQQKLLTEGVTQMPQALIMISKDRLDGFVADKYIGIKNLMAHKDGHHLAFTTTPVLVDAWYATFNKSFYQMQSKKIERFWQAVTSLRGKYQVRLENNTNDRPD